VVVSHPGVQRDILSQLEQSGPSALVYPTKLFHHCIAIGLRPVYMELSTTFNCPLVSYNELSNKWSSHLIVKRIKPMVEGRVVFNSKHLSKLYVPQYLCCAQKGARTFCSFRSI
jgi:hypothetical protein